jgi:hypothetical protein
MAASGRSRSAIANAARVVLSAVPPGPRKYPWKHRGEIKVEGEIVPFGDRRERRDGDRGARHGFWEPRELVIRVRNSRGISRSPPAGESCSFMLGPRQRPRSKEPRTHDDGAHSEAFRRPPNQERRAGAFSRRLSRVRYVRRVHGSRSHRPSGGKASLGRFSHVTGEAGFRSSAASA